MGKTKAQLRTENSANFPNNNSQFITPERLRDFNTDIIDSLVVSSDSGSFVTTASFDSGTRVQTFTKADGSTFTNTIPGGSGGSTNTGSLLVTSSFNNTTRLQTFTKGDGSTYTNSIPTGDTGSFVITGSVSNATSTFTKGDGSTFGLTVNNVVNSTSSSHSEFSETSADVIVGVKNTSGVTLPKGTPIYATGVTGENINIASASNDSSTTMPAIGLLATELTNNATGNAFTSGKIIGVNTDGFTAGRNVYVNTAGTFTQTKPTGTSLIQNIGVVGKVNSTEGEILIQGSGRSNDLPNITSGSVWVGNASGVPTPTSKNKLGLALTGSNNIFGGNQTFNDITVNGTGSFAYIQSVTGSAKIIGDAFLILNADTPTQRYAGIKIEDTGSATTASFEWDGDNDKWITIDEGGNSSNMLVGPEGTKGSEGTFFTNVLIKSLDGTGKTTNSSILDNGTDGVRVFNFASIGTNNGHYLEVTGSGARRTKLTTGTVQATTDGSRTFFGSGFFGGYSTIYNGGDDHEFGFVGQSSNYSGDWVGCGIMNNADGGNSYTTVLGFQDKTNYTDNAVTVLTPLIVSQSATFKQASTFDNDITGNGFTQFNSDVVLGGLTITTNDFNPRGPISSSNNIQANNLPIISETVVNSISASSFVSASTFIGDGSQLSNIAGGIFIETGSYYATSNDLQVTGSFSVSKAIGGQNKDLTITSNTASVDLRDSNTYTVTLVSSADTHIDVTQFGETAQSLNLLVKQPSSGNTGSISFSNDFKFGGGYSYQPTPSINSEDILSFTRFGNSLYGTFINNFS